MPKVFCYRWIFQILISINIVNKVAAETRFRDCSHYRYQAFAEEVFFLHCALPSQTPLFFVSDLKPPDSIAWFFKKADGKLHEAKSLRDSQMTRRGNTLWFSPVIAQNSGIYICSNKINHLCVKIKLDVIGKDKGNCLDYGLSHFYFLVENSSRIACPSMHCYKGQKTSNITWYKNGKRFVEYKERYSLHIINGDIFLNTTYVDDRGLYVCDYNVSINGSQWTVRGLANVDVGVTDTRKIPIILFPENRTTINAELGKPLDLKCRVQFGFERNFKPIIKWEKIHPDSKEGQIQQKHLSAPEKDVVGTEYILTSTLDEVTTNDLKATFRCYAENSVGISTTVIKLVRKQKDVVFLVYILCFSLLLMLIFVIVGTMVYIYWIELALLYRNYISRDETLSDKKDFDAFISYARTSFITEEEFFEDCYDEEKFATQILPSVLEDKYKYNICLLERDILPGGVYIEDIVSIIKRSRRVIFILSPRYITGPSLFELHTAIKCLMEEESLKLILIKFKPFKETDSLPTFVKKSLKALPMVTWKENTNIHPSQHTKFWNRVRYYMPVKKPMMGD